MTQPAFLVYSDHNFDTVDHKIAECEFFLQHLFQSNYFEFNCYFSAYLSSSRTITLSLQHFFHIPGFKSWYEGHRSRLKSNEMAKQFLTLRNNHVHGGKYPVSGSITHKGKATYFFRPQIKSGLVIDNIAVTARRHFVSLLKIVYDCYVVFGPHIDPQQRYTRENFAKLGKCIDDAETEAWGWVCTHLIDEGLDEDDRWDELRGQVDECHINHLFYSYLGKPTPQPLLPDYLEEIRPTPEDQGWIHIPAGYSSLDEYNRERDMILDTD